MRAVSVMLGLTLALVLQTTLARYIARGAVGLDLVLVAVVFIALAFGPVTGMLCGAAAGLMQDVLVASPVIGIAGLAKTIVGFLAGLIGTQLIVVQPIPRFVVFLGATALHAVIFIGLYTLLDLRQFGTGSALVNGVAAQAAANAVVGVVAFQLVELVPGAVERRKATRHRIRR